MAVRAAILAVWILANAAFAGGTAAWEFTTPLPTVKPSSFAVKLGGAIYLVGGSPWENGGDQDGSVYKLLNGTWSTVAPITGVGPAVGQGGGVDSLGRILIFGGMVQGSGDFAETRAYLPSQGPVATPPEAPATLPPLNFSTAVDNLHRIYRMGGGGGASGLNYGGVARYDAATNSWATLAYLPYTRASVATCYDGLGHVWGFGGYTSFGTPRIVDTIRYTIATNTWESIGLLYLPVATSSGQAVLGENGKVYVIGGYAGWYGFTPTATVYVLDPGAANPVLQTGPSLNVARADFGAVLGDDGFIYVIGGVGAAGPLTSVERLYTRPCAAVGAGSGSVTVAAGGSATFTAPASGGQPLAFAWEKDGVTLQNGTTTGGSVISGATTTSITIQNAGPADAGAYVLVATNPCGPAESAPMTLSLQGNPADLNHDGSVNGADLGMLLAAWGACPGGTCPADINGDGVVNGADLGALLAAWG